MIGLSIIYKIWSFSKTKHLRNLQRQGLQLGEGSRILADPKCFGSEPYLVSIGRRVTVTSGCKFITHDGGTWVFREQQEYRKVIKYGRITIHDNCFIGMGSTVMPGVSIGPNSVVAAGAVVTKNVPAGEVWGGFQPNESVLSTNMHREH